jgi:DNA-binding HxlR family transcriptional regulator
LNVQRISHDAILGEAEFQRLNSTVEVSGQRAGPLRFGDPKVQTLLSVLLLFRLLARGFSNRDLREHWAPLLGTTPDSLTSGQMTYQLRRLRMHGLIERISKSHRYQLTPRGAIAIDKYTKIYNRVLRPELATLTNSTPSLKT